MNPKTITLGAVLLVFVAGTEYVISDVGFVGFLDAVRYSSAAMQIFVDLCIALGLVLIWMVRDARERGHAVAPYVVATLCLGSIGPLAYLIRREWGARSVTAATPRVGREAA